MTKYSFAGEIIESEFALSAWTADARAAAVVSVRAGVVNAPAEWRPVIDGVWEQRTSVGYAVRIHGMGDLLIADNLAEVIIDPLPDATESAIDHAILDVALASRFGLRGEPTLHATSVAYDDKAACFVAPSGSGKSTLAAACVGIGARFLADDCVRFDPDYRVIPTHAAARLHGDSLVALGLRRSGEIATRTGKERLIHERVEVEAQPCAAIVQLRRGQFDHPHLTRLSPMRALDALISNAGAGCTAASPTSIVDRFLPLADALQVFELQYPTDLDRTAEVASFVMGALSACT